MNDKSNLPATAETLNKIGLAANVTMEDVVNIFVSRFENNLIARRTEVQKELQRAKVSINNMIATLREAHIACAKEELSANPMMIVKDITGCETTIDEWDKNAKHLSYQVNGTFRKNTKFEFKDRWGNNEKTWEVTVRFALEEEWLKEVTMISNQRSILKQDLVAINNELQGVDRKARHIKGMIAERKLEAEGMSALLNDESMAALIALPQLPSE